MSVPSRSTLKQRVYRLAEALLALKELEYLGETGSGSVPERIGRLIEFILGNLDARYETDSTGSTVPELRTDVCSACHPFFTGEQRIVDTEGRVDRFYRRLEQARSQQGQPAESMEK